MVRIVLALLIISLWAQPALSQSLRSDSPLWTTQDGDSSELGPRNFSDEDGFGCAIPLRLGIYRRAFTEEGSPEQYVRIENYGVIHCALLYGESYDLEYASSEFEDYAWLVQLHKEENSDTWTELVALQIGVSAGSRYIILKRQSGAPTEFLELDWRCPSNAETRQAQVNIWVQDACIVTSKADLRRIARQAAGRTPIARWELLPPSDVDQPASQE